MSWILVIKSSQKVFACSNKLTYLAGLFKLKQMKKTNLLLLAAGLGLALSFQSCKSDAADGSKTESSETSDEPKREKYRSDAGSFAIDFQGTPEVTTEEVPTEVGSIMVTMYMYEKSRKEVHIVGHSDYPAELVALSDPMEMLKGAQEGVTGNLEAVPTDEKTSEFEGNKALEFRASGSGFNLAYKLILVENRLYQIGIMKETDEVTAEEVDAFIGSFELTK